MKKSLSLIVPAAALLGASWSALAASTVLYTEDWGTTNGGRTFAAVGWTAVEPSSINPPYVGFYSAGTPTDSGSGAPLPAETVYYTGLTAGQTEMIYTVAGAGTGGGGDSAFTAIDPSLHPGLTLSVEASDEGSSTANYFAVQVGGAWYVSTIALAASNPTYPQFALSSLTYTTQASAWNQLTVSANGVTIGAAASANLSGPITGIGIVQFGAGGWNYNEVIISEPPITSTVTVYTEDWGTTNGGRTFPAVGWTAVEPPSINPPYVGFYSAGTPTDSGSGTPLPAETVYYTGLAAGQTEMIYTVAGAGAGSGGDSAFTAIDPLQYPGLTLAVEASDEGSSTPNYFAVQVGGAWYVSATALSAANPSYPQFALSSLAYTTQAAAWNQLAVNANDVTIGSAASANLSGPITGIGIVQSGAGGWNYNEIIISQAPAAAATGPSATIYSEDWGTPFLNATGTQNGAANVADVGWSASGIAYTGSYSAPGSIDVGTGVTFPPPPLGNINGTNNSLYASLDQTDGYIGVLYTTDTNGPGADGDVAFSDINPANYPGGVVLNMESQFNSTTLATNYFAVQVGGQWYVSAAGFTNNGPNRVPVFAHSSLVYNPQASNWNTLSFQEGAVNPADPVSIGARAGANLSGPITGVGIVVFGDPGFTGGATGYGINFAAYSITTPLVNSGVAAPKIDAAGFSQTAFAGGTASFAVDAFVGAAPLAYTWTLTTPSGSAVLNNGATGTGSFIIGANSNSIAISNVSAADAGTYSVEVANLHGSDFSANYSTNTLTVNPLPSDVLYAETFPVAGPFPAGESPAAVGWTAAVSSSDNPNRLDEAGSLYAFEAAPTTMGFFTSSATDVPGLSGLPFTNINPASFPTVSFRASIADPTGDTATAIYFAVEMTGGQWYASSSSIQLAAAPGVYNTYGLQFSTAALEWNTLTVSSSAVAIGSVASADLTGNIIGAGIVFVFGATAAEYDMNSFELVTDPTPPVLASFPSLPDVPYPQTVYAGGGASFYFTEAGTLPLTNNWKFNGSGPNLADGTAASGSVISGSQTTEITIENAGSADAGAYDPFVSNPAGTTDLGSSPNNVYGTPTLTVNPPPLGLIYTEVFPLYKPVTANQPFSLIGWTNQSDVPARIYQTGSALVGTGAAYAYESIQTNSLFYASTASDTGFSGLPFIAFDPANYPAGSIGFSTSMEAGNAAYTNVSASFAVEQGGQWYAMVTPVAPAVASPPTPLSTSAFTTLPTQYYSPLASQWHTLTLAGTAGVIVGGTPAQNLSGPISAAGLLFQSFGTAGGSIDYNSFTIQATGAGSLLGGINIGPEVNGSATLSWIGNAAVNVQSSTDLKHWTDLSGTLGMHSFTVLIATSPAVYYRLAAH
ncbi:MAG TPA: immunoglobulin domain-containing protein [Verrucomicrobiae bacterium]